MEGPILLVLCSGFSLMRGWDTVGAQGWRPCPLTHPQPEGAWGGGRESRPSSWLPSLGFFFFFFPNVWAFLKDFFLSISCAAPEFQENR